MIIFDASTLILITKADLLDQFLISIIIPVAIPGEVEKECCGSKKALDAMIIQKALDESRIEVFTLRNRRLVAKLQTDFSLGRGEAEAIALALDEKAQIIGIDDKNGIDACKVLGIAFTTAVGILIRSREKGLLEKPDAITKLALLAKHGRYKTFNYRGCETEIGGKAMSKTMSIRMDRDNYEFLHEITKEERSELSKAVRDLVTRGRILLAVERYKKGEASLGRAAELAGLPLGQMITILTEFGVESRLEKEDYLQGLRNLHKVW